MKDRPGSEWHSTALFRLVGYGLLALSLFDYVNIFIPPNFTNPIWEFQMMGEAIEKSPVPLIGSILVFYGKDDFRKDLEEYILKFLSWAALFAGIAFFLLIPLGINNTIRINTLNNLQINNRLTQQLTKLERINNQLNQPMSQQEINNIFNTLNIQSRTQNITNPEQLKSQLLAQISTAQKSAQNQSQLTRTNLRFGLLKKSVKWNFGAIICGFIFIRIWQVTSWAR